MCGVLVQVCKASRASRERPETREPQVPTEGWDLPARRAPEVTRVNQVPLDLPVSRVSPVGWDSLVPGADRAQWDKMVSRVPLEILVLPGSQASYRSVVFIYLLTYLRSRDDTVR